MEKIAIIELNPNFVKLKQADVEKNKCYVVYNEILTPINLLKNYRPDCFIKNSAVKEVLEVLKVYKEIIEKENTSEVFCYASSMLSEVKNIEGFLEEITNATNFKFGIMEGEEEINLCYTAVINSFNKPKGLIINISDYNTQMLVYNRRNIINKYIIPYGRLNLLEKFAAEDVEDRMKKMHEFFLAEIKESPWNFEEFMEDWQIIGVGSTFKNLGLLSRRAKKYPLEIEHNYDMTTEDAIKVFDAIKNVETLRTTKIKGLSHVDSMLLQSGLCIVNAIFELCPKKEFAISRTDSDDGRLFNYALPLTLEKPLSDTLGYSLQLSNDYYDKPSNSHHIYELSLTLFRLFKVIHKLNRSYVRVLRIASFLVNSGDRTGFYDRVKSSFSIIENTTLYGVSHSEIVLACFVSKLRDADNYSLAEWVKYKEVIGDVDIKTVRRLAIIIKIAEALDITKFGLIKDVDCDILGDSFILKLITEGEPKLEIKHAELAVAEFRKAYGKGLEFM